MAEIYRRWTESAIACWKRGCVCKGCIYENFFQSIKRCRMKSAVIALVKQLGPPPNLKEKKIILERNNTMENQEKDLYNQLNKKFGVENMTLELNLKKVWEYEKSEHLGGIHYAFTFKNGYGASVIKNYGSYGATEDKWELAITKNKELVEVPSIFDDLVKGWLSDAEVEEILKKIEML